IFIMVTAATCNMKGQEYNIIFYNVENLFDTVDDTLTQDNEFLPEGERRWTNKRYWEKIDALARVIAASGGWNLPVMAGLCEVENADVVEDLVFRSVLEGAGYGIVHRESPDSRGIDLALLYRRDDVRIIESRSWIPEQDPGESFSSRNLLYIKSLLGNDTLHLILCHWPSRRGGTLKAEAVRKKMATLVGIKVDSLQSVSGKRTPVIVMGDFNAVSGEPATEIMTDDDRLINMSDALSASGRGSYRYRGSWEMIDQVFVTPVMCDSAGLFVTGPGEFRVVDLPFLLKDDPGYPGRKPRPTYSGFTYEGGYSDHLPVMITIRHRTTAIAE
ncbi:MAG: endonuclease, partial [Bacteroidales bacterium]|nr:endonuclease [Bacteroidales bacterium]